MEPVYGPTLWTKLMHHKGISKAGKTPQKIAPLREVSAFRNCTRYYCSLKNFYSVWPRYFQSAVSANISLSPIKSIGCHGA